jgi:tellurite methyltransferase
MDLINKKSENDYWNDFYSKNGAPIGSSDFAKFCLKKIPNNSHIFELGCGNGRDSLFFYKNGHKITACDLSKITIDNLKKTNTGNFFTGDFTNLVDEMNSELIDVVYSRFTFHSIEKENSIKTMGWVFRNIREGGLFFIEVRSIKDDLFGKGTMVNKNSFVTDHFRRFIDKKELEDEIENVGFEILESFEGKGLAVYKNEDPVVIRIIARKRS